VLFQRKGKKEKKRWGERGSVKKTRIGKNKKSEGKILPLKGTGRKTDVFRRPRIRGGGKKLGNSKKRS